MRKLVVIAALALLATSPAFAKSRHHTASSTAAASASFKNAYGSIGDPTAVRLGSTVVGHDPDPNIRTRIWVQSQSGGLYSR